MERKVFYNPRNRSLTNYEPSFFSEMAHQAAIAGLLAAHEDEYDRFYAEAYNRYLAQSDAGLAALRSSSDE